MVVNAILTIVPTLQRGNAVRDALRHTAVWGCQVDLHWPAKIFQKA
ncbi:DUF1534 domain-containing protein [Pseudomonas syringae]|nr:DUF1534 domain-containing protein [Pseudomonas syringae]MCF5180766.1 DUF1534 domain-containing protein [Pseudomonas syringae]MCF5196077.1 DUF1534 domain-containing protein [Pseudomonas syringae]MCF5206920.1 DUF1534 domain-containing protein [Pseudomonas syringae]MCF5211641.1 DUF1534 domain-containing protein [Pseudomonas syringae]